MDDRRPWRTIPRPRSPLVAPHRPPWYDQTTCELTVTSVVRIALALLGALVVVFGAFVLTFHVLRQQPAQSTPVYTIPTIPLLGRSRLVPGQTVFVHGFLIACGIRGQRPTFELSDTRQIAIGSQYIDVAPGPGNTLLDTVHRIPLLGALFLATVDDPITGRVATYRLPLVDCPTPVPCAYPWRLLSGG